MSWMLLKKGKKEENEFIAKFLNIRERRKSESLLKEGERKDDELSSPGVYDQDLLNEINFISVEADETLAGYYIKCYSNGNIFF